MGTRKMGALRLTSLCLDHRRWGDAARRRVSHQGLWEKPLFAADLLWWVRTCLPTVVVVTLASWKLS